MNRSLKNVKTLIGLFFTVSFVLFGYFGKNEMMNETDSRNATMVSDTQKEVMSTKRLL